MTMRRPVRCLCAVLFLCAAFSCFAQNISLKNLEGGLFIDFFPMLSYSTSPSTDATSDEVNFIGDFYNRPTFLSGGLMLKDGPASALVIYEFQQDIFSKMYKKSIFNLPDSETGWYPDVMGLGTFYPNVGYVDYNTDTLRFSLGRRKIKDGHGTYSLGISSDNPFYDHVAASLSVPVGKSRLAYDYVAIGEQRWNYDIGDAPSATTYGPKFLFLHRASWNGTSFSLGLTEYNIIADVYPDFQDASPFLFYHNFFNGHQNVMLGVDFETKPLEPVSVYGQFVLDDFQLGAEGSGSNPTAFGASAGLEWRIFAGDAAERKLFYDSDHVYGIDRDTSPTGLTLRAESYLCSTYLYRRNGYSGSDYTGNEAFTSRYMVMSNWRSYRADVLQPFFAAPLAPDTFLTRLALNWTVDRVESSLSAEYRLKGSQSDQTTYNRSTTTASIWPTSPTTEIALALSGLYNIDSRSIVTASASAVIGVSTATSTIDLNLGYGRRLGVGTSPSR